MTIRTNPLDDRDPSDIAKDKYFHSEKGKAVLRKYLDSEKGKKALKRYFQSEKGKEAQLKYYQKKKAEQAPLQQLLEGLSKYLRDNPDNTIQDFLKEL